jgi:hypothetical protein
MCFTGKFSRTYKHPFAVLPLPVIAKIIGLNSTGTYFLDSYYPIFLKS